ncbi:tRNA (guanine(26)-N(2))-dimethyltransferase [Halovivax limisalsi]|uniref:tRNA (guanine(26)-N(2))-dimethyltransferase n=1 Tax=Halovivax limisalsi TaxID=1453760 RepID=UPI001FFD27A5|nr:tRNA (guanine(26)-N(2))-dimethyltransferase [Halovivax limisalsi]
MRVSEGGVEIEVPGESTAGVEASVFYNPRQALNRDLTIAVLRAFRDEREPRAETYLDAMTASGIRGIRAATDGWTAYGCDLDEEAVSLARENAARTDVASSLTVVREDANAFMYGCGRDMDEALDVIDLDPYGTPMPYADAAFANARNLVCVTATDTAPLCGAHFRSGVRSYGAIPRNTDYHPEMGVRILLSALARSAARQDVGVTPIFTHASSHYVRTYLELDHRATAADAALEELGFLHHCEDCLYREADRGGASGADPGLIADPLERCPNCGGDRVLAAGPVWLGAYRDPAFVAAVRERIPDDFGTAERARSICDTVAAELDEPTHYDQHRLCKEWSLAANAMDDFLDSLRAAGHAATPAHYGGTTFKTDADVGDIEAVARETIG